jgi:hypothetical protein
MQGLLAVPGYPFKRSHLVALRVTKISANDPPSMWWPGEEVSIPWKGDYSHNSDATYSPDNRYRSGWSKNFLNGTPQEGRRIERDGVLRAELIKPKASTGPLRFIILMHGWSGLTDVVERWAKEKAKILGASMRR